MCGIAGIVSSGPLDCELVRQLINPLTHRGPDGHGIWLDDAARVGLGHRRLAIIDLSPHGHQPMLSKNGRWALTFNGEIYNHLEIRAELDAGRWLEAAGGWVGHSDTETLVEAIACWGLESALQRCTGMFALGLWDRRDRELSLARDRFGEKPLYYGWVGGDFLFGSELKAFKSHPRFDNDIDRGALRLLAARSYVPAPLSIYQRIYKLEPACILKAAADVAKRPLHTPPLPGARTGGVEIEAYWSYRDVVANGLANPIRDGAEALQRLEAALAEAVQGQSVADVPVGAFLSGGIDSSTVVAIYQKYSPGKVRTFSIGFEEAGFNEAEHAKAVAQHFGTEHNEKYVSVAETRDVIPSLPQMYDEPFGDSSQIPTHLVSKFAREQVTVALSGDGGDELFGGYNRYFIATGLWSRLKLLPAPLRRRAGRMLAQVPPAGWNKLIGLVPGARRPPMFGTKVQKVFRTMGTARDVGDLYNTFLDGWTGSGTPVLGDSSFPKACEFDLDAGAGASDAARMMYCDATSYLPDDILCKVDRAAMAVSLETRVPFLDHHVADVAARIPESMKFSNGKGKQPLRQILYREAPERLFDRPKAGFGIPVGEWIRGPLRPWAEELLDPSRLRNEGYFDVGQVRNRWQEHLEGRRDATESLWSILMFQAWNQTQMGSAEPIRRESRTMSNLPLQGAG